MIIGLSGYARSGKDTVANILVSQGFTRVAFADAIRESLFILNPLVGDSLRLQECIWMNGGWEGAKILPEVRTLLQVFGTDVGRKLLGENVWVDVLFSSLNPDKNYVVSDVRFENECEAILSRGGEMWRINRADVGPVNGHISDSALDSYKDFAYTINNSDSLTVLNLKVMNRLEKVLGAACCYRGCEGCATYAKN